MWTYQHTDELYHYGVLGMKWGKRKYQNKDGSLTPAGQRRYNKLDRELQKTLAKDKKIDGKLLDARAKNRSRIESRYDKKIAKAEKKGYLHKAADLKGKKNVRLEDFDGGTAAVKTAMRIGTENRTNVMKLSMKALSDPSVLSSKSYQNAKKWAKAQTASELFYGRSQTLMMETQQAAINKGESWTRGKLEN